MTVEVYTVGMGENSLTWEPRKALGAKRFLSPILEDGQLFFKRWKGNPGGEHSSPQSSET